MVLKLKGKQDVVAPFYNSRAQKGEAGGLLVQSQPRLHSENLLKEN